MEKTSTSTLTPTVDWRKYFHPTKTPVLNPKIEREPPILYYFAGGNVLCKEIYGQASVVVADFSSMGDFVRDAIWIDGKIAILGQQEILLFDPANGESETLVDLKTSIRQGQLLYDSASNSLIYRVEVEDPQAVFGFGILLGIYNIDQRINHEIPLRIIEGLPYHILGFDADINALYLLQLGNDAGWDRIWIYNLDDGQLIVRPGTRGDDQRPVLSPDFNFLATSLFDDASNTGSINVYTIAQPEATPQRFPLPDPPSHFSAISWSPDGQQIYFLLKDGRIFEGGTPSDGIWSVDITNGKMHQISTTSKNWWTWYQLDSQWVILIPPIDGKALIVNLISGQELEFPLPDDAGGIVHSTGH